MGKYILWTLALIIPAGWGLVAMRASAAPPMAATNVKQQKACGLNSPCPVAPNTFGYYETRWRPWPGQARPDKTFPQSLGREQLPTPPGEPSVPLPKAQPRVPSDLPQPPAAPYEGSILPPGGLRTPGGTVPLPGTPGVPGEPGVPQPPGMPGLPAPLNPPMNGPLPPGLPLDPQGRVPPLPTDPTAMSPAGYPASGAQPGVIEGNAARSPGVVPLPAASELSVPTVGERAASPVPGAAAPHTLANTAAESLQPETFTPNRSANLNTASPTSGLIGSTMAEPKTPPLDRTPDRTDHLFPQAGRNNESTSTAPHEQLSTLLRLKRAVESLKNSGEGTAARDSGFAQVSGEKIDTDPSLAAAFEANHPETASASAGPESPSADVPRSLDAVRRVDHLAAPAHDLAADPADLSTAQRASPVAGLGEQSTDDGANVQPAVAGGAEAVLDGFCPVSLIKNEQWVRGDPQWSVVHLGRTYYCAGPIERECFLVNPDRYVPALGGADPVILLETARRVPGKLDYCVTYDGKLYMFTSAANLAKFRQDPRRFVTIR